MASTKWTLFFRANWKFLCTLAVPVLLLPVPLSWPGTEANYAYMILLMALFWVLELLPLAVTALFPVVLCPLLGIMGTGDISMAYMKGTCMLYLGGNTTFLALTE